MGTSLGYGQGMEYQYLNAPQPSQPIEVLRQERLQQLREDLMRRRQRRMRSDMTNAIPLRKPYAAPPRHTPPPARPSSPPDAMQASAAATERANRRPLAPPASATVPFPSQEGPATVAGQMPVSAMPAQDTGMLQRGQIRRASLILTGSFMASRMLGLLRTSLFSIVFGAGLTSDAYIQAFFLPDFIFNIVAGGALSSAFIPVFTRYMVRDKDEKTAWHIASSALNLAIGIMIVLAFIAMIGAGWFVPLYNLKPDNLTQAQYTAHLNLIVSLTRIMLLQSIILGGSVIITSVLNARQHFMLPAIGTVIYNVGLIIGLLPGVILVMQRQNIANNPLPVYAATIGVVIGAILQLAIQIPGLYKFQMRYTFAFDWRHPGVIQIGRQMVPRIINAAMLYFSTFVDRYLITFLGTVVVGSLASGLVTEYYQAFQLLLLPLGIFGMSISTAAFPTLAENVALSRYDRVRNTIMETLRSILFISIPSSVGLIVVGLPIIQVILEHGAYNLTNAQLTAFPLTGFAFGLAALSAVEILTRSFYAMRDSTTPVIVSIGQFIFKIALSVILINAAVWGAGWGTGALAFSTSVAGILEAFVLLWLLHLRVGGLDLRRLAVFTGRVLLASVIMGGGVFALRFALDLILNTTSHQSLGWSGTIMAIIKLLLEVLLGLFIYIRAARFFGIEEMGPIKRVLDRLKLSWI